MRARNIKPGFYKNEALSECSAWARLLYPGLWMLADRKGCLEYRPKRWKAELFPYDSLDTVSLAEELEHNGLIVRYSVNGIEYVWIPRFLEHQNPHKNEPDSDIPPFQAGGKPDEAQPLPERSSNYASAHEMAQTNPADSLIPDSSLREKDTLTSFECLSSPGDDEPNAPQEVGAGCESVDDSEAPPALPASTAPLVPLDQPAVKTPKPPACPYEQVIALYHAALPEHQRVEVINAKRRGAIKARWGDVGGRLRNKGHPDGQSERLSYLRRFFLRAAESDFLTGKKMLRDGTVYRVDFDKLISPGGFVGVIEGKYANREAV